MRPPAPTPPSLVTRGIRQCKSWNAAVLLVGVAITARVAWVYTTHHANVASLYSPRARLHPPDGHDATLSDLGFAYDFSRIKPVGSKSQGVWDRILAVSAARDASLTKNTFKGKSNLVALEEVLGDRFLLDDHVGFTRCSTTAYALATYFCGAHAARWVYALEDAASGVAGLRASIAAAMLLGPPFPQAIWHVHVGDEEEGNEDLGHVFVLRMRSDGQLELLESFIDRYTLQEHLEGRSGGAPRLLDAARSGRLLADLDTLERSSGKPWGPAQDDAYLRSFGVSVATKGDGTGGKRALGKFTLSFSVPCVVPPWDVKAGAVDVEANRHEEAVRELVHPLLQGHSLTLGSYLADGSPDEHTANGARRALDKLNAVQRVLKQHVGQRSKAGHSGID